MKLYYGGYADYMDFVVADNDEQAVLKIGIKINAPFLPITVKEIAEVDGFKIQAVSQVEVLINACGKHPATEEPAEVESVETETETFRCKKCDFTAENNGQLLAHYRKCHPKGD